MGVPNRRRRVCAPIRGPDGSAFQKCKYCNVLVAVALADMHDCNAKKGVKRVKGKCTKSGTKSIEQNKNKNKSFDQSGQPRSAFRFFMECFVPDEVSNPVDVDRKGFETWRNMSKQDRLPYILQAEKVNVEYERVLLQEVEDMSRVNEEADSAEVGKFDKKYDNYSYSNESNGFGSFFFGTSESFNSDYLLLMNPWAMF